MASSSSSSVARGLTGDLCMCAGAGCLGCRGAGHLFRDADPAPLRRLLARAVCVVGKDAPPPPRAFSVFLLSQREVVRKTSQSMLNSSESTNILISCNYDKKCRSSPLDLLCSWTWAILLERIGNILMYFLLRYSTIFLPVTNKSYHQVTGPPFDAFQKNGLRNCVGMTKSLTGLHKNRLQLTCTQKKPSESLQTNKDQGLVVQSPVPMDFCSSKSWPQCFPCLLLHACKKVTADCQIERAIFYNKSYPSSLLPHGHMLSRIKPNNSGADTLLKHIFGIPDVCWNISSSCPCNAGCRNSKCNYQSLLVLFKSVIRNAKHCHYKKLLDKHCWATLVENSGSDISFPIVKNLKKCFCSTNAFVGKNSEMFNSEERYVRKRPRTDQYSDLLECDCKHSQIVSFVYAVLRSIIPECLLGDVRSWRLLRKIIWKFVHLRRFEKFYLKDCIDGMKGLQSQILLKLGAFCCCYVSSKKAMDKVSANHDSMVFSGLAYSNSFNCLLLWIFSDVVVPIIRQHFYVTETEHRRYDVLFYEKSVWRMLTTRTFSGMTDRRYEIISDVQLSDVLSKRTFGFSKVRFLPKENSLRLLANLRAPSALPVQGGKLSTMRKRTGMNKQMGILNNIKYFKSVNSSTAALGVILKGAKFLRTEPLGSSVYDYNDVYKRIHQFRLKLRTMVPLEVFIVVADVQKAFDSINQEKLLKIIQEVINKDAYDIRKCKRLFYNSSADGIHGHSSYCCINNSSSTSLNSDISLQHSAGSGIFVDKENVVRIRKNELFYLLNEHVTRNILQIGQKFYLQKIGISQGSLLSTLLCSFYYGHMERNAVLPYLERSHNIGHSSNDCSTLPDHLLMRFIDDFLFISTSRQLAESFLDRLCRGFAEYNCYMNDRKFGVSFGIRKMDFVNRIYVGEDGSRFMPWSGLLFNCRTLEVQADYTRYLNNSIRSCINIQRSGHISHLLKKLCTYMSPKCHPILYDTNINSPAVVRLNLYQAFLLCAMKFHCYISDLHDPDLNSVQLLGMIQKMCRYTHRLIYQRFHNAELWLDICPVLKLRTKETIWLGLSAFTRVLRKKQARHKELLQLLMRNLEKLGRMDHSSAWLRYAVDDSHSSIFWKLKY